MVTLYEDSKKQRFADVGNMRITLIPHTWTGQPGLRFQAYREEGKQYLHRGAEVPIPDKRITSDLVSAIERLCSLRAIIYE